MANTILVLTRIAADNVDAYNRSAIATTNTMNGTLLTLETGLSTTPGKSFVFNATPLADADEHKQYWMACSPEVNVLGDGTLLYKGINNDPRSFFNPANVEFDVFAVQIGDIVQVSAPFFAENFDPGTVTGAKVVEYDAANNGMTAKTTPTVDYAGIKFKIIKNFNFVVGSDSVPGWLLMRVN